MKPGLGEFDRDGPESFTALANRIRFLILANILEPKLLCDLHSRTYHLLEEFILTRARFSDEHRLSREFGNWKSLFAATEAATLHFVLKEWSQDWSLDADWCRDLAVKTLWYWCSQSIEERGKNWGHEFEYDQFVLDHTEYAREIVESSRDLPSLPPPAGYPAYRPAVQLRKEYLLDVEVDIRLAEMPEEKISFAPSIQSLNDWDGTGLHLQPVAPPIAPWVLQERIKSAKDIAERYCDRVESLYNSLQGWHKTGIRKKLPEQLLQAILFQVLRLEYGTIAEMLETTPHRVGINVRRVLRTIILRRRHDGAKRGRPGQGQPTQSKLTKLQKNDLKTKVGILLRQLNKDDPTNPAVAKARAEKMHQARLRMKYPPELLKAANRLR